jgi:hypothetical protein
MGRCIWNKIKLGRSTSFQSGNLWPLTIPLITPPSDSLLLRISSDVGNPLFGSPLKRKGCVVGFYTAKEIKETSATVQGNISALE